MRFCPSCGASIAPHVAGREQRKVVSVLFADLVDFTGRSQDADPEDVRAMLREYHGHVKATIERFGGVVEKFIGDAVMAVFGAPVSHGDDAERAVQAALEIPRAIDGLNHTTPGLDLAVRVPVNTGETMVDLGARPGEGEAMVAGDVVNTAARLQTAASLGESWWVSRASPSSQVSHGSGPVRGYHRGGRLTSPRVAPEGSSP